MVEVARDVGKPRACRTVGIELLFTLQGNGKGSKLFSREKSGYRRLTSSVV